MKPKPSPLSCTTYFVSELSISANSQFDWEKESEISWDDLEIETQVIPPAQSNSQWQIVLEVTQNLGVEANAPYNFAIKMVGFFDLIDGFPKEKEEHFVSINGSSLLYGMAREILRSTMASGPYFPIMLPTVSFFDPEQFIKTKPAKKKGRSPSKPGQRKVAIPKKGKKKKDA